MSKKNKITDIAKAQFLIDKGKIDRIIEDGRDNHYIVTGKTSIYLVILPDYCSCDQFTFRCLRSPGKICYHIIAAKKCENPGKVNNVDVMDFFKS